MANRVYGLTKLAVLVFSSTSIASIAWANGITASGDLCPNLVGFNPNVPGSAPVNCVGGGQSFASGTASVQKSITNFQFTNDLGGTSVMNGSVAASASFGSLHIYANADMQNYSPGTFDIGGSVGITAQVDASFTDTWTVLCGTAFACSNSAGFLDLAFTASGTASSSGPYGDGQLNLILQGTHPNANCVNTFPASGTTILGCPGDLFSIATISGAHQFNGAGTLHFSIPVTFGLPQQIQVDYAAFINVADASASDPYSYSSTMDFSHTLTLSDVAITDPAGNLIDGATFSATSGTAYPLDSANSAPEPCTLVMLATGLLGLACMKRMVFS